MKKRKTFSGYAFLKSEVVPSMISFGKKKSVILNKKKLFSLKIQFQYFLRYTYRYLIKTLKIRLIFIYNLMNVLNGVNELRKAIKTICYGYVINVKKSFFISSKKLNLPLIKFINN
jgi:hypothetical protein